MTCLHRVGGVDPLSSGSGTNSDGLYYNFAFNSSGDPFFVPFKTLTTQGSQDGRVNIKVIQDGTIDIDFRIVSTANAGNTFMELFLAGVSEEVSATQTLNLGPPGNLYQFLGISVLRDQTLSFRLDLVTNLGQGIGYVLINYT